MILVNGMYEAKSATTKQLESLTLLLAPFATELAEKMWQLL
jgi:leucyl-tRNA synthetase